MENSALKSVTFGGFDKQSVIDYIEKASQEHAAAMEQLQRERDTLQSENDEVRTQLTDLTARLEDLERQLSQQTNDASTLREELNSLQKENAHLQAWQPKAEQLEAEVAALRPDAEAYRQFRSRLGDIECEARKRAADLESASNARLRDAVAGFRESYQKLTATLDTASGYMTGELRKIEVTLSQLPRSMDQVGVDLKTVEDSLKKGNAE